MRLIDIDTGSVLYELGAAAQRGRVLLAEDDPALRDLLAAVLRRDGFDVVPVDAGDRLLDTVCRMVLRSPDGRAVDLVISDLRMPALSGLEVLEAMRSCDWSTPFILITAFADDDLRADAERLGAAVLAKPFDLNDLRLAAAHLAREPMP